MRIIAGAHRGRTLVVPRSLTRPTTDRVRESLFGQLGTLVEGARVLDLYAGSGGLGLEALSRGAASCDFVEQDRQACAAIKKNLAALKITTGQVITSAAEKFLAGKGSPYDLIFADPPYADGFSAPARDLTKIADWTEWLDEKGYLILEQEARGENLALPGLAIEAQKAYGRSRLTRYSCAQL